VKKHSKESQRNGGAGAPAKDNQRSPSESTWEDQYSHFCILDAAGEIVKRGRVSSTQAGLEKGVREDPGRADRPGDRDALPLDERGAEPVGGTR